MGTGAEIAELERKLAALKEKQRRCQHVFGPTKYNPYDGKEEYLTGEYETQGVHHWPKSAYRDVKKPRWTRVCTLCDFEEHTEKQRPIPQPTQMEPDFGGRR